MHKSQHLLTSTTALFDQLQHQRGRIQPITKSFFDLFSSSLACLGLSPILPNDQHSKSSDFSPSQQPTLQCFVRLVAKVSRVDQVQPLLNPPSVPPRSWVHTNRQIIQCCSGFFACCRTFTYRTLDSLEALPPNVIGV